MQAAVGYMGEINTSAKNDIVKDFRNRNDEMLAKSVKVRDDLRFRRCWCWGWLGRERASDPPLPPGSGIFVVHASWCHYEPFLSWKAFFCGQGAGLILPSWRVRVGWVGVIAGNCRCAMERA